MPYEIDFTDVGVGPLGDKRPTPGGGYVVGGDRIQILTNAEANGTVYVDGEPVSVTDQSPGSSTNRYNIGRLEAGTHTIKVGNSERTITLKHPFEVPGDAEPVPPEELRDGIPERLLQDAIEASQPDPDNSVDPSEFAAVVNADNSDGTALAPAVRRRGIEVDDVGTTATVQGEQFEIVDEGVVQIGDNRIEVGDITDSDEVARVTDGPNAGDPIATDADVAPDSGSGGGMIGAIGVAVLALLAGAAALLGGGD